MQTFNIFGKVKEELKDFFEKDIEIAGAVVDGKKIKGYSYNQFKRLQAIEYIDASTFLTGDRDSEGQQKFFVNKASFYREVSSKNIDIDVKHFNFMPEEDESENGTIILRKKFRRWSKEQGLSEKINDSVDRFPKYGSVVGKKVGKEIEIVPLLSIRNQQDAKTLNEASYVIIEHNGMTYSKMSKFPNWNLKDLDMKWDDEITVYERYGEVPLSFYNEQKGLKYSKEDELKTIYTVTIITTEKSKSKDGGTVLFIEETEEPFVEAHYSKQDGRWLGIGEMEKQIENQAGFNMIFNMMKKGLSWSVKNIFQIQDDTAINNLVREVKDGDVLKIDTPDGFKRVDTQNRATSDSVNMNNILEKISDQRAFAFEAATGEGFTSGTPFRLGAIVGQSVQAYYSLKREKLGLFWKNIILNFMIPSFFKETPKEFIECVADTEDGFETLRQLKIKRLVTDKILELALEDKPIDTTAIKMDVELALESKPRDYYKLTKKELENLKYRFDIDITGESIDTAQKIETLTTLYTVLAQKQDPASEEVLKRIMILTGEKMPRVSSQAIAQPTGQTGQVSGMEGMLQNQVGQVASNQVGEQ